MFRGCLYTLSLLALDIRNDVVNNTKGWTVGWRGRRKLGAQRREKDTLPFINRHSLTDRIAVVVNYPHTAASASRKLLRLVHDSKRPTPSSIKTLAICFVPSFSPPPTAIRVTLERHQEVRNITHRIVCQRIFFFPFLWWSHSRKPEGLL